MLVTRAGAAWALPAADRKDAEAGGRDARVSGTARPWGCMNFECPQDPDRGDDAELRDALVEQLGLHEFESVAVDSGTRGVQAAKAGQVDLVIMDVGLPDIDGREAVRILRKNGFKAPIIMLTGHNTDSDTILGLEKGTNDYVAKPFRFVVLLARIRAQLRQHEASEDALFSIGPYTFRPS